MQRYIVSRIFQVIVALLGMSMIVFLLARMTGDPRDVYLSMYAGPEEYKAMGEKLGLDKPLLTQYGLFIANAVRGDFGRSLTFKEPAMQVVMGRLGATVQLAVAGMLFALLIAVPLGVITAVKRDHLVDYGGKALAVLGQSVPGFWLGIILILLFAVIWPILPAGGKREPLSFILPAVTLGWSISAGIMRLIRSAMLDVLGTDYVTAARIMGLRESMVIWKHSLKNALIPAVTFSATIFGHLLLGSVTTEIVFSWPGIGRLAYQAVLGRDYPLIQAITLLVTVGFVTINLVVDILYAYLDPRVRY